MGDMVVLPLLISITPIIAIVAVVAYFLRLLKRLVLALEHISENLNRSARLLHAVERIADRLDQLDRQ